MMILTLSPMRRDETLTLAREGEALVVNGQRVELAGVATAVDAAAFGCEWIVGEVRRADGALHLTVILPHGPEAPEAQRYPAPLAVEFDGPVALPGGAP